MSDHNFPTDEAQIVALFTESIVYGIYLVSFAACIRVLFSGIGLKTANNKAMFVFALLLALFGTLDLAFGMRHALDAFIFYQGPGGANAEYADISYWVNVMKPMTWVMQTLIGDLILLYRCFMVYDKRWLVIAGPSVVWTATLVCGSAVIFLTATLVNTDLDDKRLAPFLTATISLTLAQNLVTTSLLAFRIWSIDRRISAFRSSASKGRLRPLLRTLIESGAMYTLSVLLFLITHLCEHNSQYAVSDCGTQIIGIVFNMIIIRVHQGRTAEIEATSTLRGTSYGSTSGSAYTSQPPLGLEKINTHGASGDRHGNHSVQVNVVRQVTRGDDVESSWSEGKV